jgi:hypothetical protein
MKARAWAAVRWSRQSVGNCEGGDGRQGVNLDDEGSVEERRECHQGRVMVPERHIVKRPVLTTSMQRTKMEHARYGKEPYSRIA